MAKNKQETRKAEPKVEIEGMPVGEALTRFDKACQDYGESFQREQVLGGTERPKRFDCMLRAIKEFPTLTNSDAAKYIAAKYLGNLEQEFRARPVSGEWEKGLLICRGFQVDKADDGWNTVKRTLQSHGWNATVSELRKAKLLPDAEKRNRKARNAKGKSAASVGDTIPTNSPDVALQAVRMYLATFFSKHFSNGLNSLAANPTLARLYVNTIQGIAKDNEFHVTFITGHLPAIKEEEKQEKAA